ncbi:HD domain-containing protein [Candidatus Sumerlaeota bacterium]|nr:HD domain-containing protein [Candidatus Sumerlaeota bacterium]
MSPACAHNNPEEERGPQPCIVRAEDVINNPDVRTFIGMADRYLEEVGYTSHGDDHIGRVGNRAGYILEKLGCSESEVNMARIAGYLHDIGNVVHRDGHPQSSACMAFTILREMGMPAAEIATIMGAIGNHDEEHGAPASNPAAALIIADKSDVRRSRVRNPSMIKFDIHDRVNYAATSSDCIVEPEKKLIVLNLEIDTEISTVAEYFEIFLSRMIMSRRAANYLNCDFALNINGVQLM